LLAQKKSHAQKIEYGFFYFAIYNYHIPKVTTPQSKQIEPKQLLQKFIVNLTVLASSQALGFITKK